ncbi:MAG: DUF3488 and transglutaminase-like domain-containing protein [Bryobacteraceae bacterium]|nr:DUF3488 and transglutaminase-like domain-containing protein [Bryobacteraceae bacterium]
MRRSAGWATQPVEQFFQFSLLGLLATGFFALVASGSLDLVSIVFTGAGLVLRLLLLTVVKVDLNGRWVVAATLGYCGFYPLDVLYLTQDFVTATVHLICFLAVVRVLTARTNRDYLFVKLIAFLELLAATLLSASIGFFVFLTLFLIFGVATFCCSEIRRAGSQDSPQVLLGATSKAGFGRRLASLTALMTVSIVLMTGGLFFLLPRTARAAFRSLVSERYHLPGFSGEVTLGQLGELKQESTAVLHARIAAPDERLSLKWRGAALSQFDGLRWYNPPGGHGLERIRINAGPTILVDDWQRRRPGQRISYEVRVGPVDTDALFFAGVPELLQVDDLPFVYRVPGDSYRTGRGTIEGRNYRAIGHLERPETELQSAARIDEQTRNEHLLLPGSTDKRILALARERATGATPQERARALERWLRTEFGYTTELPRQKVADPLAYFLFERRKGHCEYFASAMAVMLRAVNIPSRVVTGFQSGTFNPMTGWHVIRASDAHSWVEAWMPGSGWTTFDPTPPDLRSPQGAALLWSRMMLFLDAADTVWRDWILNYNLDSQIDLVSRVERRSRLLGTGAKFGEDLQSAFQSAAKWSGQAILYGGVAAAFGLVLWLAGPVIRDQFRNRRQAARVSRGKVVPSDAAVLYTRMLKVLRRRGLEKPAWLTPAEFARIVPSTSPDATLVSQITSEYNELRYGGKAEAGPRMIQLIQELETNR